MRLFEVFNGFLWQFAFVIKRQTLIMKTLIIFQLLTFKTSQIILICISDHKYNRLI